MERMKRQQQEPTINPTPAWSGTIGNGNGNGTMVGNFIQRKMHSFRCFEVLEFDFMTLESGSNLI
jgi:hypothetical protein